MANTASLPLVAVDIGNSRIKLGDFEHPLDQPLPHPQRTWSLAVDWTAAELDGFLPREASRYSWAIASVNRPGTARLLAWLTERKVAHVHVLEQTDLPLTVDLAAPEKVGIDRLVNALAANRLRVADRPAIIVDSGSAITVDLLSADGAFAGGAILPSATLAARALHEFTDLLPLVEVDEMPPALGKSTVEAIRSGLFWGAVGAVRELVARLSESLGDPQVFLTGGGAASLATILGETGSSPPPRFVPHLTLAGVALAAAQRRATQGDS